MYGVSANPTVNLDWFDRKGVYLVPKTGYETLIAQAMGGERTQKQAAETICAGQETGGKSTVSLSKKQIKNLAQTYNPRQMSQEEYQAFVDELCQSGVLADEDKPYLACGSFREVGLVPLQGSGTGFSMVPASFWGTPLSYNRSFSSSNGNVLDWASYLATFRELNPDTQRFEKSQASILFEKIADILTQMQNVRS